MSIAASSIILTRLSALSLILDNLLESDSSVY